MKSTVVVFTLIGAGLVSSPCSQNPAVPVACTMPSFAREATRTPTPTPSPLARDLLVPIHAADDDEVGVAYGVWAAGGDYKVSFHDGMTFVPMLGRHRRSESMTWQTSSVRVGEHELLVAGERSGRRVSPFRYEFDLGAVVEAYDVGRDGLEQTFVIAERPAAPAGDLVVTGVVGGTVSSSEVAPLHRSLAFTGSTGEAVIGYGAATAVDVDGRRFAMTTSFGDGRVELRLPAAMLAEVRYPLVVDPILGNMSVAVGDDIDSVDVFRDHQEANRNLWISYTRFASATDRDLIVQRYDNDFSSGGQTVFADIASGWDSIESQITGVGNGNDGRTITVFTRQFSPTQSRVRWHVHDKDSSSLGTTVSSMTFTGAEEWRPDVGGSFFNNFGVTALIVYQREDGVGSVNVANSEVLGLEVNLWTNQRTGPFPIGNVGDVDAERPSINQINSGSSSTSWMVAWQEFDNTSNGPWRIVARRIGVGQTANGDPVYLPSGGDHAIKPEVGGMLQQFLVSYGERPSLGDKPLGEGARRLSTQRFEWRNAQAAPTFSAPERQLRTASGDTLVVGASAFDYESRWHWSVTYVDAAPGSEQLRIAKVGYDGRASEDFGVYQNPGFLPTAAATTFDYDVERFAVVFSAGSPTVAGPLFGTYLTFQPVTAPVEFGVGCGISASQSLEGNQLIGSPAERFQLQIPLAATPVLFTVSFGPSSLPLDPMGLTGCQLAVDPGLLLGSLLHVTDAAGLAEQTLPIPSTTSPFELHTQWFVLVPGVNPAGLAASSGMKAAYVR